MRLIDADKLYPDSVSIKGDRLCISQSQIANAPTVDVLDKIRADISKIQLIGYATVDEKREIASRAVMQIIDKYRESEDEE